MPKERETENLISLGNDLKEGRKVLGMSRRALAEMVNIDLRYLVNIENSSARRAAAISEQSLKSPGIPGIIQRG